MEETTLLNWFGVSLVFCGWYFAAIAFYLAGDTLLDDFFGDTDDIDRNP